MDEVKWMALVAMAFVLSLFGGLGLSEYAQRQQNIECIKAGMQVVEKSCVKAATKEKP